MAENGLSFPGLLTGWQLLSMNLKEAFLPTRAGLIMKGAQALIVLFCLGVY